MQTKIRFFARAMPNYEKEFTIPFNVCRYGNQVKNSLSSCSHICSDLVIPIAEEVGEKEKLKNLLKWDKFSIYVMVNREMFTYLRNKK